MRGDTCVAVVAVSAGRDSHSGGCVIQQGRGRTCLWLWVNMRVVGNGHRLVDAVLVAQVINAAVGVKKEKLSCDEVWWPSTQQKRAVVVLASCHDHDLLQPSSTHSRVLSIIPEPTSSIPKPYTHSQLRTPVPDHARSLPTRSGSTRLLVPSSC